MNDRRRISSVVTGLTLVLACTGAAAGEQPEKTKGPTFEECWNLTQDPEKPAVDKLTCWTKFNKVAKARSAAAAKQIKELKQAARDGVIAQAKEVAADTARPASDRLADLDTLGKALSKKDAKKYILPLYVKVKKENAAALKAEKAEAEKAALGELAPALDAAKAADKSKAPAAERIAAWTKVLETAQTITGNQKAKAYATKAKVILKKLTTKELAAAKKNAIKTDGSKKAGFEEKIKAWQELIAAGEAYGTAAQQKAIAKAADRKVKRLRTKLYDSLERFQMSKSASKDEKLLRWKNALPLFVDKVRIEYATAKIAELEGGQAAAQPEEKKPEEKKPEAETPAAVEEKKPEEKKPEEKKPEEKKPASAEEVKLGLALGAEAPRFTLRTMNAGSSGQSLVNLDHHVGKAATSRKNAVLLSFWADYCKACKEEIPVLNKLYAKYKDKGLLIVSVCIDKKKPAIDAAKAFVKSSNLGFPVLLDRLNIVARRYNIERLPAVYFIGPDGKVKSGRVGYDEEGEEYIHGQIRAMLGMGAATEEDEDEDEPPAKPAPAEAKPAEKPAEAKPAASKPAPTPPPADDEDEDEDEEEDD